MFLFVFVVFSQYISISLQLRKLRNPPFPDQVELYARQISGSCNELCSTSGHERITSPTWRIQLCARACQDDPRVSDPRQELRLAAAGVRAQHSTGRDPAEIKVCSTC